MLQHWLVLLAKELILDGVNWVYAKVSAGLSYFKTTATEKKVDDQNVETYKDAFKEHKSHEEKVKDAQNLLNGTPKP